MQRYTQTILTSLALCLLMAACGTSKNGDDTGQVKVFEQHSWLLGTWVLKKKSGGRTVEAWVKQAEDVFTGLATSLNTEGDTTGSERIMLRSFVDGIYFVADVPHNPAPVKFRLTSNNEQTMVFENPEHDFPKKITYTKNSMNSFTATISDGSKNINFNYERQ